MPFELKITFTGMLFYAPDGTNRLQVLFPATGGTRTTTLGSGGHLHGVAPARHVSAGGGTERQCTCGAATGGAEPHVARVLYDTAHANAGRTSLDRVQAQRSLRGVELRLGGAGGGIVWDPPAALARLGTPRTDVLDGSDTDAVAARVVLTDGRITEYDSGGCWRWKGKVRRMAHVIEWTIAAVDAPFLQVDLVGLTGGHRGTLGPLYPVNGRIALEVWHAPAREAPPQDTPPEVPTRGMQAHHFAGLQSLLANPEAELPEYVGDDCPDKHEIPQEGTRRGTSYTCMGGGG